jgi:hypothetical protein
MKTHASLLLRVLPLAAFLCACKREPDVIVTTTDGMVIAVNEASADTVVETDKGKVVVNNAALVWPALEETIRSQIKALNAEDVEGYMSYVHRANPGYDSTKDQLLDLFAKFDLRTTLEKLDRESITEDEAKVSFVQLTEKASGPAFKNNRTTGIHTLRKDDGKWKIFATETRSVTVVDPVR